MTDIRVRRTRLGFDMLSAGERIRRLRERKGWTQLELAEIVKINNSVLSRIESGKRPVEDVLIVKFAEVFNVTTDYLLGMEERVQERQASYRSDPDLVFLEQLRKAAFYQDGRELSEKDKKLVMEWLMENVKSFHKIILNRDTNHDDTDHDPRDTDHDPKRNET